MMSRRHTTWLAACIGARATRLCHVERVDGVARAAAWLSVPTRTDDLPQTLREALTRLANFTGSRYLDDRGHLMRANVRGWGCDAMTLCLAHTSPLRVLIAGLTTALSVQAARQALQRAGAVEVGTLIAGRLTRPWEVAELLDRTRPTVVVLVGGTEGGAVRPVLRLARLLAQGLERLPPATWPEVVLAGNAAARAGVHQRLPGQLTVHQVANVLPAPQYARPRPLIDVLRHIERHRLQDTPGFQELRRWTSPQGIQGPGQVLQRLLRFWQRYHGLSRLDGAWWLDNGLWVWCHDPEGDVWETRWFASPSSERPVGVPQAVREGQVAAAIWTSAERADAGLRRWLGRRGRRSSAQTWVDEEGLSLLLATLAPADERAAAEALLSDGLMPWPTAW